MADENDYIKGLINIVDTATDFSEKHIGDEYLIERKTKFLWFVDVDIVLDINKLNDDAEKNHCYVVDSFNGFKAVKVKPYVDGFREIIKLHKNI